MPTPSIRYDASRASLYRPGDATDFFEYGPTQTETEAALCSEMARLTYVKEKDRLSGYLRRAGFELQTTIGHGGRGTQAFIATAAPSPEKPLLVVVAYRGTESDDPTDLTTDARLLKTPWLGPAGEKLGLVHVGFADALLGNGAGILTAVLSALGRLSAQPARILLTGHSLGAALATLTACFLGRTAASANMHLYTYGSPLVGDAEFMQSMQSVHHSRHVNCCDIVTRIPPEILGYVHTGTLRYIDREGSIKEAASRREMDRDRFIAATRYIESHAFQTEMVGVRELADHSPINYVSALSGLRS